MFCEGNQPNPHFSVLSVVRHNRSHVLVPQKMVFQKSLAIADCFCFPGTPNILVILEQQRLYLSCFDKVKLYHSVTHKSQGVRCADLPTPTDNALRNTHVLDLLKEYPDDECLLWDVADDTCTRACRRDTKTPLYRSCCKEFQATRRRARYKTSILRSHRSRKCFCATVNKFVHMWVWRTLLFIVKTACLFERTATTVP